MLKPAQVVASIKKALPDAEVTVEDLSGGGDHFQVNVISTSFMGLSLIKQHQLVYGALQKELASEAIHALALNTSIPN
ncbi:BolA family protein [Prochlorococcus marinus]|uniref:BolA-like protein n=1 Tax=Prochlorococcus marinus (strain MIT 9211) TaxID=93059 RepID=A9BAZ6_PROM4|nr:BolA/IbaG family iron-sulfur metabolism protein [Prochlorococcus marinus]ABX09008.1 BolA-like protein [Prochlorococcus marinus str. MIT 9211]